MAQHVHPTAVIDPSAIIHDDVEIGPYCTIGPHVTIGPKNKLYANVHIIERTVLGECNEIYPNAVLGGSAQDTGHRDDPGVLQIGSHNTIREFVTLNRGTSKQDLKTVIGDHNLFMAYTHVAHDCVIGNNVVLANLTQLAGHTQVDDYVITSASVMVHQFCTLGTRCFLAPMAVVKKDCLPGVMYSGNPAAPKALNLVGLNRAGYSSQIIRHLKDAYRRLVRNNAMIKNLPSVEAEEWANEPIVSAFIRGIKSMIQNQSGRGAQNSRNCPAKYRI